jgi:hypothetical protein
VPGPLLSTKLCPAPDESHTGHRSRQPGLVHAEEAGTFWVWAWPEILGWPVEITWLFSPVTGNDRWPGDLWGIDVSGELIILETKRFRPGGDPFEDFLEFEHRLRDGVWLPPTVDEIRRHWEGLLEDERRFLKANRDALQAGSSHRIAGAGVVPYSSKRLMTWRWRGLYLERIAPTVDSPAYERSAVSSLERLRNRSWSPHYFALFTVLAPEAPSKTPFSARGRMRYEELRALVSPDHVHLRSIRCTGSVPGTQVAVECSYPDVLI